MHNYKWVVSTYNTDGTVSLRLKKGGIMKKSKGISNVPMKSQYREFMKKQERVKNIRTGLTVLLFLTGSVFVINGISNITNTLKGNTIPPNTEPILVQEISTEVTTVTTEASTEVTTETTTITTTETTTETVVEKKAPVFSMNTSIKSNLTENQIEKVLNGTPLQGHGWAFIQIEEQYGVNALFAMSVCQVETGFGSAGVGRSRNNGFGMKGSGGFRYYDTLPSSVLDFGRLISTLYWKNDRYYVNQIAPMYCDYTWGNKVESAMYNNWRKAIN